MKKIFGTLVLAAVMVLAACDKPETEAQTDKPVVRIGVVTQLSGNMSMVGEGIKNAIILAQEDLKKRNLKNNYQFVIEDDAYEARKTAMIFPKLKDFDKVDAILSSFSQTGKIISPRAEEAKILHIGIASDPEIAEGKYNFSDWTMPKNTSGRILQFYKDKGIKKVVAIVPNNIGALPLYHAFMEQLRPEDGIDVSTHMIQPEEKDFKMLFAQTAKEKPDAYLALIYGASFVPFLREFQVAHEQAVITSIETFAVLPDFSFAEGAYFTDAAQGNAEFIKKYEEQFGRASSYGSGNMYDMVMLTVEAFENAEDKARAVDELAKIRTYNGVIGKLTQDENGIFNSDAVLKKIINGVPTVVDE